jgi:hypothetical protein
MTQQSKKHNGKKSDQKCPQPSQEEIDGRFVFGRNFTIEVSIENVRLLTLETANQLVSSQENAKTVYLKLRSEEMSASALLTLRPVLYNSPGDALNN